jgi:hypothetical protein
MTSWNVLMWDGGGMGLVGVSMVKSGKEGLGESM